MNKVNNLKESNGISLTINMVIDKDNYDINSIVNLQNDINSIIVDKYNDVFKFINGNSEFIKFEL